MWDLCNMPWQKNSSVPTVLLPAPADEEAELIKGRILHSFENCIGETMFLLISLLETSLAIQRNSIQIFGVLVSNWNLVESHFEHCTKKGIPDYLILCPAAFLGSLSESPLSEKTPSHRRSEPPLSLRAPLSLGQLLIKGRVEFSEAQCFGSAWGSFLFGPTHHLKLEKPRETKGCGLTKLTDDNGRYFDWGQHWFWKLLIILLKEQ